MTVNIEYILRKMMGWCPNASTIETRKSVQFDDMVNAPGSDGELTHATARWWNKYHNRILLNAVILTLMAMNYYISYGRYNPDNFLAGIIYGLIVSIFTGITEWRRLNKAAAGEFKKVRVTRKKKIMNYLIIFGFIIVVMIIVGFIAAKTDIRISGIYATLSGFILFVWTQYLEVVYWEWKNRKTLIVEKTSFYAIDIEAGGR
ncbi:MAG: DUF1673 family protein [Candidatus Methanoperedens sp.]